MKKSGVALVIVLIVLMVVSWIVQLGNLFSTNRQRNMYLQQASQYCSDELYQKAIESYESALKLEENEKVRVLWLEAYEDAYSDQAITAAGYADALETMCQLYPKEAIYWERLLQLHLGRNDLYNAHKSYKLCKDAGVSSPVIRMCEDEILYSFRTVRMAYKDYVRNTTGYYTVFDGELWGVLRPNGETVYKCMYEYVGPYSEDYFALFVSEKGQRIANAQAVVQGKIDVRFVKTGTYSLGMLPVCGIDGIWRYLDCDTHTYVLGTHEYASNFIDGVAAVCDNGKWQLIDSTGAPIGDTVFTDIKIHSNGDYARNGIMIAKLNGTYGMYDAEGKALNDFRAKDMDVYMGGDIAFQDTTGKWGFVNKSGVVSHDPAFAQAKSFSAGLAAVSEGGEWGFINTAGTLVIDRQFLAADYFTDGGICMVSTTEGEYNIIRLRFTDK